jgi:hypothetical protein
MWRGPAQFVHWPVPVAAACHDETSQQRPGSLETSPLSGVQGVPRGPILSS